MVFFQSRDSPGGNGNVDITAARSQESFLSGRATTGRGNNWRTTQGYRAEGRGKRIQRFDEISQITGCIITNRFADTVDINRYQPFGQAQDSGRRRIAGQIVVSVGGRAKRQERNNAVLAGDQSQQARCWPR